MAFGVSSCSMCLLCNHAVENRDHLFFTCPFSSHLWTSILAKSGIDWLSRDWLQTIKWMEQYDHGSLCHLLIRLSFTATVYFIWRERNARFQDESPRPISVLLADLVFVVRTRANLSRKVKPSYDNNWLHLSWQLSDDIF